jgi:hypothetical protein
MQITYCKYWSRFKKRVIELWDEKKALKAHNSGKLYTVLIGEPEKPDCFLEIALEQQSKFVGVSFLDDKMRDYLDYAFQEVIPGKLFLSRVILREYSPNTDTVSKGQKVTFKTDGHVVIEKNDLLSGECLSKELQIDVSSNWESFPEFGQYESISRLDRPSPNLA